MNKKINRGKLQYIQDKNKNNFNKLFQELSEIING